MITFAAAISHVVHVANGNFHFEIIFEANEPHVHVMVYIDG